MNCQASVLCQKLGKHAENTPFDMMSLISLCTLDIICETAMGCSINAQENSSSSFVQAVHTVSDVVFTRIKTPLLWPEWLFQLTTKGSKFRKSVSILHSFTDSVIQEKREKLNKQTNIPDVEDCGQHMKQALLDLLLQESKNGMVLTDADIREQWSRYLDIYKGFLFFF